LNWFKTYKNSSDEDLMRMLQGGDQGAFDEVYRRYSVRLLHFMYKMISDEERSQDLLQDLFLLLVESPEKFNADRMFRPWVFTVAANMCRKEFRSPIQTELFENIQTQSADELIAPLDNGIFKKHLRKQLQMLEYEQKTTFILRYQEGLAIKQIAEIMECSVGTVKSRIYYTNKKLAERLREFKPLHIKH
jgi:RNA polymerase sigma-70 factor (ECF subfamily)